MIRISAGAVVALLASSGLAWAQQPGFEPAYGSADLSAADDHRIELKAGGHEDASRVGRGCVGMVADYPDFVFNYTPGEAPLIITATSRADTTLLLNFPDGSWACNDDGGEGDPNPGIVIHRPPAGRYDVWVGAKQPHPAPDAVLRISATLED